MTTPLPQDPLSFVDWKWADIEPHFRDLEARPLTDALVVDWLTEWRHLAQLISEIESRLSVAKDLDTADQPATQRYQDYCEYIVSPAREASQRLKEKLIASELEPERFDVYLKTMRTEAALFREANLPLLVQDDKMDAEYNAIIGAQTVVWNGAERTIPQMRPIYLDPDREQRETAWRLCAARQLADRETLNALWARTLTLRRQLAANAGKPSYIEFRWDELARFDYTPDDCFAFHDAIERVIVPAAERIYEKRRQRLGVESLRPWDLDVDPLGLDRLRPFTAGDELATTTAELFRRVDPQLGDYFDTMRREGLLDLDNHKGKAPGGYCTEFCASRRPYIFMNSVGLHDDVQTMLHEGGHAFHNFESYHLPTYLQGDIPIEFCEVASMSMELLAAPYFTRDQGGFYATETDANRARVEHLEGMILFLPYMAVVDGFQLWAYRHPDDAMNAANCDAAWGALWERFMRGVEWGGLEAEKVTGWHRKQHIFRYPLYYVEYGLAQVGATQVWRNAVQDQAGAVAAYRRALALGGTRPLPDLFAEAGARFAWDVETLTDNLTLIESTIARLDPA
ncbi:MAG: M3 family oligoendopeptidase [Chloroflexota bacterium]|nr:M3 family oligoendopeptidase [Chloroflexota bacterium]